MSHELFGPYSDIHLWLNGKELNKESPLQGSAWAVSALVF